MLSFALPCRLSWISAGRASRQPEDIRGDWRILMIGRCFGLLPLLLLAMTASAQDVPVAIKDSALRPPASDNPIVNPSSLKPLPSLPAKALAQKARSEEEEREQGWGSAQWTHASLQIPGSAQQTIKVAAPSNVLVRATWRGSPTLAVSVVKQGATVATTKAIKRFDGDMVATAQAKLTSAGDIVIQASDSGSQPAKVDVYVGILAAGH
jgi:hypothetical protein